MYHIAACLICLRPVYGKLPDFFHDQWRSIASLWTSSHKQSSLDLPTREYRYGNRETEGNRAGSLTRIIEREYDDLGLGGKKSDLAGGVSVNRTFEMHSETEEGSLRSDLT